MQRYGQKTSKMPQKWGFSPICDPPRFFKNRALSLLYPYGALTSCKKLEKTNEQSLRYLKTDGQTDQLTTDQLTTDKGEKHGLRLGKARVEITFFVKNGVRQCS